MAIRVTLPEKDEDTDEPSPAESLQMAVSVLVPDAHIEIGFTRQAAASRKMEQSSLQCSPLSGTLLVQLLARSCNAYAGTLACWYGRVRSSQKPCFRNAEQVIERANIHDVKGKVLVEFNESQGTFDFPRGRYSVEMYSHFMRMHGSRFVRGFGALMSSIDNISSFESSSDVV